MNKKKINDPIKFDITKAKEECNGCLTFDINDNMPCWYQEKFPEDFDKFCPCIKCLVKMKCNEGCEAFNSN